MKARAASMTARSARKHQGADAEMLEGSQTVRSDVGDARAACLPGFVAVQGSLLFLGGGPMLVGIHHHYHSATGFYGSGNDQLQ